MTTKLLWSLSLIAFVHAAVVVPADPDVPPKLHPFEVTRVLDGDTVEGTISLGWDVQLSKQVVRCLSYDAWESSKRRRSVKVTDEEVQKGKLAAEYMRELSEGGVWVREGKRSRDNYGRILGELYVAREGKLYEVADLMRAAGHCRVDPDKAK